MLVKQLARAKILSLLLSALFMATSHANNNCHTQSGFTFKDPENCTSFKIGGLIKFDESVFFGADNYRHKDQVYSINGLHGNLRAAELSLSGDFDKNWAYKIGLSVANRAKVTMMVKDAALSYKGFKNSMFSIGQVTSAFGLENSSSSKYSAFLERSIAISTFERGYGYGLGINYRFWSPHFVGIIALMQPKDDAVVDLKNLELPNRHSDKWSASSRLIYLPINKDQQVFHIGVSGAEQRLESVNYNGDALKALSFKVSLEGQGRQGVSLVHIPSLQAKKFRLLGMEAALMQGPLFAKVEGLKNQVERVNDSKLGFYSWNANLRYLISGENYQYDSKLATLAPIKPTNAKGALELAVRLSQVSLNSKDIYGGRQQNLGIALNWYLNNNVKISGNLINAHIRAANNQPAQPINILGMRIQYIW